MGVHTEEVDSTVVDTPVVDEVVAEEAPGADNQATDEPQEGAPEEGESEEVIVTIGDEAPPLEEHAQAPAWVKELRKTNRELQRQNRELQGKLQAHTAPPVAELGKKPRLEDHDYDAEKYEEALAGWFERKRQADAAKAAQDAERASQQQAWQAKLQSYTAAKSALKVGDFEDAEAAAQELFSVTQQGVVLSGADNPALVVYALGKNPKKAKELAAIKDPVKFAFAVAKLETELKVTNRKSAPPPEKIVSGTGRVSGAVDSTLERLRAEAEKTGDLTKVLQYKRQQSQKRA